VVECLPLKKGQERTPCQTRSPLAWAALETAAQLGGRASQVRVWSREHPLWRPRWPLKLLLEQPQALSRQALVQRPVKRRHDPG
jgi:hypothetical protein